MLHVGLYGWKIKKIKNKINKNVYACYEKYILYN